jgi:hypothetical protein
MPSTKSNKSLFDSPFLAAFNAAGSEKSAASGTSTSTMSTHARRVSQLWQSIQKPLRNAYSAPTISVSDHLQQVRATQQADADIAAALAAGQISKSDINLPKIDKSLAELENETGIIEGRFVEDKTRGRRHRLDGNDKANADVMVKAPTLRKSILLLNFAKKTVTEK